MAALFHIMKTLNMEICENMEERKEQTEVISSLLGIQLPGSYKRFLIESGSGKINDLPVFGLPMSLELDSVWGATEFLRSTRSDLPPQYLAIRFMDSRALCLDLRGGIKEDAPLVETDLKANKPPRTVHNSFHRYLNEGQRSERQIKGAFKRIKRHLQETANKDKKYEHNLTGSKPPFKMRDWRVIRSCVHDQIVGLTAIRYDEEFNGLEVDVFICTDHPNYQPGHGVRSLTILLLSDAYRNGGSMEIRFTRYKHERTKQRVPDRVPPTLYSLVYKLGITFNNAENGIISHSEAVNLYSKIIGLSKEVLETINEHEAAGRLTLQGLCYLLSTHIWTIEEASWILLNYPRPEGVLFGADLPEDRLNYSESVSYGRSALLASKLGNRLKIDAQGNDGDCFVSSNSLTWIFKAIEDSKLDWEALGCSLCFTPTDIIEVLPRPRVVLPKEISSIEDDVKTFLKHSKQNTKKFLLYSSDFRSLKNLNEIVKQVEEESGIGILIAPFECRELDNEVDQRMSQARILRR